MLWVLVMLGAAVGAPARWLVDRAVRGRYAGLFPLGTFSVNMLGSLVLGVVLGVSVDTDGAGRAAALLGTGFCGAFTTFSTFSYESVVLAEEGSPRLGVLNLLASLALGVATAWLGWSVGHWLV